MIFPPKVDIVCRKNFLKVLKRFRTDHAEIRIVTLQSIIRQSRLPRSDFESE
jgi:hypothetical protein